MKTFFVHHNRKVFKTDNSHRRHQPKGMTICVSEHPDPRQVNVQITFCSNKDEYSKRAGRDAAQAAPKEPINKRALPFVVSTAANHVEGHALTWDQQYYYLYKYLM